MADDNSDLLAERQRLEAEVARLIVSRDSGVPVDMLSQATTESEARAIAEAAIAWKAATQPAPTQTAAVPAYSVGQISRSTLPYLSPEQQMAAWRQGRLAEIGAPAPDERRNGEHHATH